MPPPAQPSFTDYARHLAQLADDWRSTQPPALSYVDFLRALARRVDLVSTPPPTTRLAYFRRLSVLGQRLHDIPRPAAQQADALDGFRRLIMARPDDLRHRLLGSNLARLKALSPDERMMLGALEVEPDLLGPLRRDRCELTYSALLAYHLYPRGGSLLALTLLRAFLEVTGAPPEIVDSDLSGATVQTEAIVSEGRVDVRIETNELIVFVEVKVDAGEAVGQLAGYRVALRKAAGEADKRRLLVYLTLDEISPVVDRADETFAHISWAALLRAWLPHAVGSSGAAGYLRRYLKSIARLVERAGPGAFVDWSFFHQRQALALVASPAEMRP